VKIMSDGTCNTLLRNSWDDVPDPGPCPPLPAGDPPTPGTPERSVYDRDVRAYARWLKASRRHQLATTLRQLYEAHSPEEEARLVSRAVRVLGAMVLAGEVGPGLGPIATLLDLF